jgi:hypothetical protein
VTVQHRRNRLVSFRVSDEEYEWLRDTSVAQGARSISDFARKAITSVSDVGNTQQRDLGMAVSKLTQSMEQLSGLIDRIIDRIAQESDRS